MPVRSDITVVASSYDTRGNGGRKLAILDNGWLVACAKESSLIINFYVSKDNGATWTFLCKLDTTGVSPTIAFINFSIVAKGNRVYVVTTQSYNSSSFALYDYTFDATTVTGNIWTSKSFVGSIAWQTAIGSCSLAINSDKTELHTCWSAKTTAYQNSFNIIYSKGIINTDGSVTWGSAEQITTQDYYDNGRYFDLPSITCDKDNNAIIFATCVGLSSYGVGSTVSLIALSKKWTKTNVVINNGWGEKFVDSNLSSSYVPYSPSSIFVPQSINGITNGRIWVTWHGTDSTDAVCNNIRVSYSDDGGATWSTMTKLTSGNTDNRMLPTITCSRDNKVSILFNINSVQVHKISCVNNVWGSISSITTGDLCSSLYDPTFDFTEPLFIYKGASKVGFYGTWTVVTISVTEGNLGNKSDKSNILSYAITTDGTMSSITEKVNGATINTRTATSGQSLITGLTQAQWDAVKFGKYKDITGGLNTLTVSMGTKTWTYTFDKRLATTDDVDTAMKAISDSQTTYLPSVKAKLGSAIRNKGGSVNDTDSFDVITNAISGLADIGTKKWATGSVTIDPIDIPTSSSGSITIPTNTSFIPSIVIIFPFEIRVQNSLAGHYFKGVISDRYPLIIDNNYPSTIQVGINGKSNIVATIYTGGNSYHAYTVSQTLTWIAFE